ncbi:hypothetical protein [Amycolatopsis panacis]|uniref:Uncharacterized protein n=1 Tax=Amycolatopsis panacis TaxID=2340917 RepID=A0A419I3U0_9PSEU|nr:hypothetical protein [Amycolatopsis panacis]RJQ84892.1 hypothetical protein D5S19_15700 [Amycolatopsis panacis]
MAEEIDQLRAALREPLPEPFAAPDVPRIMAEGKRLRRRRRVLGGAGAAAAVVAVLAVVFAAVGLRSTGPAPAPVAAAPSAPSLPPALSVVPGPVAPPVKAVPSGDVIDTDTFTPDGQLVFYFVALDSEIGFGVMAGLRTANGLQPLYLTNETRMPALSFGFHATSGGQLTDRTWVPVYGYFSGPAARITTTIGGRTIAAHLGRWSGRPDVVVFWFDQSDVPSTSRLTPLIAYAEDGGRLTR